MDSGRNSTHIKTFEHIRNAIIFHSATVRFIHMQFVDYLKLYIIPIYNVGYRILVSLFVMGLESAIYP